MADSNAVEDVAAANSRGLSQPPFQQSQSSGAGGSGAGEIWAIPGSTPFGNQDLVVRQVLLDGRPFIPTSNIPLKRGSVIRLIGSNLGFYDSLAFLREQEGAPLREIPRGAASNSSVLNFTVPNLNQFVEDGGHMWLKLVSDRFPGAERIISPYSVYSVKEEPEDEDGNNTDSEAEKKAVDAQELAEEAAREGQSSAVPAAGAAVAAIGTTVASATAKVAASSVKKAGDSNDDYDGETDQGQILEDSVESTSQDVQVNTNEVSGGQQTISQSGTVSENQVTEVSGGGTAQSTSSVNTTVSGTVSAGGSSSANATLATATVGAQGSVSSEVSGMVNTRQTVSSTGTAAVGALGSETVSGTASLASGTQGNFSGSAIAGGGTAGIQANSNSQITTQGGGQTDVSANLQEQASQTGGPSQGGAKTAASAGAEVSSGGSAEATSVPRQPLSSPALESAQDAKASQGPTGQTLGLENLKDIQTKSGTNQPPAGASPKKTGRQGNVSDKKPKLTEPLGKNKAAEKGDNTNANLGTDGIKPPAGLEKIKKNDALGDSLSNRIPNNTVGGSGDGNLGISEQRSGRGANKNSVDVPGLGESVNSNIANPGGQEPSGEHAPGEDGSKNAPENVPGEGPQQNQAGKSTDGADEENQNEDEDEQEGQGQESPALAARPQEVAQKAAKEKSLDEALKKAIKLLNRLINIGLLEIIGTIWAAILSTFGLASLIIAPVIDIILLFKNPLIRSAANSRLGKLGGLAGEDLTGKGDEIAKEIKLSTSVKLNIFGINLAAIAVAFLIIIFAVTLTKALCDNWITGGIGYLKGYSSICTNIDNLTSGVNSTTNSNGQNAATQATISANPVPIAPRGSTP